MAFLILAAAAAAAAASGGSAATHSVTIDHATGPIAVEYRAAVATRMKTIGLSAGTRMGTERCNWSAEVTVERNVSKHAGAAALHRTLPDRTLLNGSRAGNCIAVGKAIRNEIAGKAQIRDHLQQVASRDQTMVLAEIDAARALALN